jgi:formylglycine-generating enzyme required for sulfatase activity
MFLRSNSIIILLFFMLIFSFQTHASHFIPKTAEKELQHVSENMVYVKGGCFQMGDIFREVPSSEKPVHEVCVDDFYMGKYEVTVGEFRTFVQESGYETEAEWQDGCHVWVGNGTEVKKRNNNWRNTGFSQTEDDVSPQRRSGSMLHGAGGKSISTAGEMDSLPAT